MKEENVDQKEPIVVALCVIHQNTVSFRWAERLRRLELPFRYLICNTSSLLYDTAREFLVRMVLKETNLPEWVFFLDSDILPPFNAIPRLIEIAKARNIPVLSGLYWFKRLGASNGTLEEDYTPRPSASIKISEDLDKGSIIYNFIVDDIKPYLNKNMVLKVDAVGTGCLLIKTDIFKKLDASNPNKPFFQYGVGRRDENTGKPLLQVTEDFYFCYRLVTELGIHPYLSTEIKCEHLFEPVGGSRRGEDGKLVL